MLETQLEYILSKADAKPKTAIVLGSGLGDFADGLNAASVINYADIPDFPVSTAPGHKGRFIFANIAGEECVLMQGRVHLYEGYTAAQTAVPIRLMRLMGAENLILTNAAGGINKKSQSRRFYDNRGSYFKLCAVSPNRQKRRVTRRAFSGYEQCLRQRAYKAD